MLFFLAGVAMLAVAPAASAASGTGSISGALTDAGSNPVNYFCVEAFDSGGKEVSAAKSKPDGTYKLEELGSGDYRVAFRRCGSTNNLISEYYDNQTSLASANAVSVTDGVDTPGINAELATGGTVSGTVTNGSIGPLEDICVDAFDSNGDRAGYDRSAADGSYTVIGLATGDYRLRYRDCAYPDQNVAPEYYNDQASLAEATPVAVTAGADTPDVDVELATGGSISGIAGGASWGEGYYCLSSATVYDLNGEYVASEMADSNTGEYTVDQLRTGTYKVKFHSGCMGADPGVSVPSPNVTYWEEAQTFADATEIVVTAGSDVPGIDAYTGPHFGKWISGTVRNESGSPLKAICVRAYDAVGNEQAFGVTGTQGYYVLDRLKPGDYRLKFEDCGDFYIYPDGFEFYEDKTSLEEATPVTIEAGEEGTPFIDAELATQGYTDLTPPDTVIDSGPSGTITTNEATFTFHSTEPDWITPYIQCSIDSGAFEDCSSPETFSDLSEGEHTVAFRAEDSFGNQDPTPATRTFTVDTTVYKAAIGKVTVKGPARVKKGRKATFRVRITNSGNIRANGTGLWVRGGGVNFAASVGGIPAGETKVVKVKVKPKKTGRTRLTFRVISSNAGGKIVKQNVTVGR